VARVVLAMFEGTSGLESGQAVLVDSGRRDAGHHPDGRRADDPGDAASRAPTASCGFRRDSWLARRVYRSSVDRHLQPESSASHRQARQLSKS
jgi:hypothetical protein